MRNNESAKQRKYEATKVRNNEIARMQTTKVQQHIDSEKKIWWL